tara:strand:- start:15038 stop:16210 length:1173 start_codon:yes stop_codon:yes gene_type:complete
MGLLKETNAQYYSGQQKFIVTDTTPQFLKFECTFNTKLLDTIFGVSNINFSVTVYRGDQVINIEPEKLSLVYPNTVVFRNDNGEPTFEAFVGDIVLVELNQPAIESNYGNYEYVSLVDIVNNFIFAYVGNGKLISRVKRSDVIWHAKRGLQEFSYDTLKSVKSQELTVPPSLSIVIPQDYVNYVRCSWVDGSGIQRTIYPTNNLTTSPNELPLQDDLGVPTQDNLESNLSAAQSQTEQRWKKSNTKNISGDQVDNNTYVYDYDWWKMNYGQRYGLEPQYAQKNGWFNINNRKGKFSFSSNIAGKTVIIEYVSDGLSNDNDVKIPKMAEQAMYMHIAYSILSTRANVPEYLVQRFKRDRSAQLRNAKIRLQNIKLNEIVQVFRGKSKQIKN